ncbi:18741_t:CDS:1, partial [Gigaspora rosea]
MKDLVKIGTIFGQGCIELYICTCKGLRALMLIGINDLASTSTMHN